MSSGSVGGHPTGLPLLYVQSPTITSLPIPLGHSGALEARRTVRPQSSLAAWPRSPWQLENRLRLTLPRKVSLGIKSRQSPCGDPPGPRRPHPYKRPILKLLACWGSLLFMHWHMRSGRLTDNPSCSKVSAGLGKLPRRGEAGKTAAYHGDIEVTLDGAIGGVPRSRRRYRASRIQTSSLCLR